MYEANIIYNTVTIVLKRIDRSWIFEKENKKQCNRVIRFQINDIRDNFVVNLYGGVNRTSKLRLKLKTQLNEKTDACEMCTKCSRSKSYLINTHKSVIIKKYVSYKRIDQKKKKKTINYFLIIYSTKWL